ncbi:MAG: O-antigen ligase domain-containing protein, partial [Bryobacteraceae bacterium]
MQVIVILPGIWAAILAFSKSPQLAFIAVYIPTLLCLPDYYRWNIPGLPDPSFSHAVALPIAGAYLLRGAPRWKFSFTDILVFGFASCVGYSEFLNAGYSEAQNLLFDMVCLVVLPYVLTKALVEPFGLRVEFGKQLVMCLFWISVVSVWEFKFARTPWRMLLDPIFPGQADGWVTTFRWGFARIAGPYGHAILAGGILMAGYRIQRWLHWSDLWERKFKNLSSSYTKAQIVTAGLVAGILMTMVRGPWLGGFLAAGVVAIGRAKQRWLAIGVILAGLVFCFGRTATRFTHHFSVG